MTATVEKGEGSWKCTVAVPFAAIGGRPVNAVPSLFARNRVVDGVRGSALYVWGPESVRSFWNSENYGTVEYAPAERTSTTLTPGNTEVVVQKGAPDVVKVAGRELASFLSRSFGCDVPLSESPTEGRVSIILGENDLSRAAGIDLDGAPTDTFVIKADCNRVYIAGRDDAKFWLSKVISGRQSYSMMFGHDRATLHGVYDFLEQYAGVRFYFPDDELGTVVPKKSEIVVPEGVRKVTPDFLLREPYFSGDGKTVFHYILTSAGNLAGQRYVRGGGMSNDWQGYVKGVKSEAKVGNAEWTGKLQIPLATIGETKDLFQINFCRHRMLTDGTEESISWSPYVFNFHDLKRFGTIVLK